MKFDKLVASVLDCMKILSSEKTNFDDCLFYLRYDGKLYTTSKIEVRYSEEIDKYAFIIILDKY